MSKKRIAVIALGYAWLPGEKGPSRFYYIADMLAKAGYDVELIGSGFQHFEKKTRNIAELKKKNYPFKNVFISVPAYRKNIDPRRIWSNWVASQNVYRYLEQQPDYDAVYCAIPPNNVAAAVSKYCKKKRIPFIVDIEDLWPEAMYMVFHVPVLSQLLYYPMYRDAERVYRNADAVVGTSEDYTERAFATRIKSIPAKTVYVGCDIDQFDNGAEIFLSQISKPKHEFWVSYAGSIGASYDIRTLVKAAAEIEREGHSDIRFKIMGTGPLLEDIKKLAAELSCTNVEILGYVEYPKMAAYLKKSDIMKNIIWQLCIMLALAVIWDVALGWHGWSIDYVFPILCTVAIASMFVVGKVMNIPINDYIIYIIVDAVLGIIPIIFLCTGILHVIYPSVICVMCSVVYVVGLILFKGQSLRDEITRKLHL